MSSRYKNPTNFVTSVSVVQMTTAAVEVNLTQYELPQPDGEREGDGSLPKVQWAA